MDRYGVKYQKVMTYLQTAFRINQRIKHYQEELKQLQYMADSIVKPLTDGGRSSEPGDPTGTIAITITERKEKLMDELVNLNNQKDDLETYILVAGLETNEETVLLKRYVELKSWEVIAKEMYYSTKHPLKIRNEAVHKLARKWER